jgi:hypothetical protein
MEQQGPLCCAVGGKSRRAPSSPTSRHLCRPVVGWIGLAPHGHQLLTSVATTRQQVLASGHAGSFADGRIDDGDIGELVWEPFRFSPLPANVLVIRERHSR